MPTRPSTYANWTDGASTKVVQPPSGQLSTGFIANQRPPFRYANWLWYILDQWTQWLDYITRPSNTTVLPTSGPVTIAYPNRLYLCDPTTGAFTLNLPNAAGGAIAGMRVEIKHIGIGSSNNLTVTPQTGDQIENNGSGVSATLTQGDALVLVYDGVSKWWSLGGSGG